LKSIWYKRKWKKQKQIECGSTNQGLSRPTRHPKVENSGGYIWGCVCRTETQRIRTGTKFVRSSAGHSVNSLRSSVRRQRGCSLWIDEVRATADFCKRVVLGDLLLHLLCELLFSFCTRTVTWSTILFSFCTRTVTCSTNPFCAVGLARMLPTLDLSCEWKAGIGTGPGCVADTQLRKLQKCGWFPYGSAKTKRAQAHSEGGQRFWQRQ
jgi:hypothetical protein